MIKAGDRVVCIDIINGIDVTNNTKFPCEIGDICIVEEIRKHNYNGTASSIVLFGDWIFGSEIFSNYFITLAEWREQQIKIVLDD